MGVKKLTAVLLIICMMLSIMPTVFSAGIEKFVDFPTGWSREAMTAAVQNGLIQGVSETEIKPEDNLTRAEFATIITRAFGAVTEADISAFEDVPQSAWYHDYIARAVKMQVLTGKSATRMDPEAFITREEAFTALARVLVISSDDSSALNHFSDKGDISDWAVPEISGLVLKDYVSGYEDGTLKPKANITREEFAQILHNTIKVYITSPGVYSGNYEGIVIVRTGGVTFQNASFGDELIIADGVGSGVITAENVTISDRLVIRGGHSTLKNTTISGRTVVKNVYDDTEIRIYKTDLTYDDVDDHTTAIIIPIGGTGTAVGGGTAGPGGSNQNVVVITIVNSNGTSQQITVTKGQTPNLSTYIVPAGYTHTGKFYTDPAKTVEYTPDVANSNFALYPDLTPITYTITYFGLPTGALDGTEAESYTVESNNVFLPNASNITLPTGHRFDGWYESATYQGSPVAYIPRGTTGNKTYYAKISHEGVVVYFKLKTTDQNYYDFSPSMTPGSSLGANMPADPDPVTDIPGYTFGGWYIDGDFSDESKKIDSSTTFLVDTTVYAKLTPIPYTITYHNLHATLDGTETVSYTVDDAVTLPTASQLALDPGYEFKGWYDNSSFTGTAVTGFAAGQTGNKEYFGKVTPIEYSIEYRYETGNLSLSIDGNEVEFLATAPAPTTRYTVENYPELPAPTDVVVPTGYKIDRWYYADDFSSQPSGTSIDKIPESGNTLTLYARVVEKDKITVRFDLGYGGLIHATPAVLPGLALGELMPADPTRVGYGFDGWYIDGDFDDPTKRIGASTIFNQAEGSTVVVYAKWNLITYDIHYEYPNGVTLDGSQPIEYNVETEVTLPTTFASMPNGYEFEGWYENNTGSRVEKIQVGTIGDKYYTARIKPIVYDIAYFYEHATVTGKKLTYTIEENVDMPTNVTPDLGYEFKGWYDNSSFTGTAVTGFTAGQTGNKEYFGKVTPIEYSIEYRYETGDLSLSIDGNEVEFLATAPARATKYTVENYPELPALTDVVVPTGYKIEGWYYNADINSAPSGTSIDKIPESGNTLTLYAHVIEKEKITVKFNLGYDNSGDPIYDELYVLPGLALGQMPADPTRAGYDFDGWYIDGDFDDPTKRIGASTIFNQAEGSTVVVYAKWNPIEYSIAYRYETGDLSLSIDGNEAEFLATAPARATKYTVENYPELPALTDVVVPTGYKIEGWYYADDLSSAPSATSIDRIPESGNTLTLYAHVVEKDKITVRFDLGYGGLIHATPAVLPGLALGQLMPADPTRVGYDFDGWYIDGDFDDPTKRIGASTIFNQAEGSTVVVYAKWNLITYDIHYEYPNGVTLDGSQPIEYNVETEVTLPTTFASMPNGYEFEGWYENNTGSRVEKILVGTIGDKNYTARIKPIVYDITYIYDRATVTEMTMTYTIEDVVDMPNVTPDLGYEFNGWYNNGNFEGTAITSMEQGNFGDKVFHAKVDAIPYFIYYSFPDGGSFINPDDNVGEYTIEQTVTLPTGGVMILPRGYKFDGWVEVPVPTGTQMNLMLLATLMGEDNFVTTIEKGTTGHKAYEAQISPIEYQINYHYPSGTTLDGNETTMFTILDTVELPAASTITVPFAYEFKGWYENDQYTGSKVTGFVAEQLVDLEDKDYYAWVAPIEYDIEYNLPDGTTLDGSQTKKYTILDAVTLPTESNVKPLAGYKFDGWYDNESFTGTPVTGFDAGQTGKKTYYALLSTIDYTISYEFGTTGASFKDGATYDTEYIVTDTVTLPVKDDITVPVGYKFAGWYYNSTYTDGPIDSFTGKVPASGVILTLYARVIPEDQYTIYFRKELTDTENYAMPTIYSGTALGDKMPKDPEKEGYTFDGWYIDGEFDDETKKIDETTTFTSDTYVYAKWDTNLYTVNFIKGETIHKTLTDIPYNTVLSDASYWEGLPDAPEETIYIKSYKYSDFVYPFDEPFKIADVYYYEKEDGTWARFDDTVAVTHDIDAYLMDKRFSMMVKIPSRSAAFGPDTPYVPGETRAMDTLKAILSNGGDTINILQDTEIFKKVENKATQLLVDKNIVYKHGNGDLEVKISELPINITRIVDGQRARQTVKQYVEDVINDPNKLDSMLEMIDINDLVDQIGTSTLISKLSDKQIVDMMKDPVNAETVENGIYSAIGNSDIQEIMISYLNDTMLADGAFRTEIAEEFKNQLASDGTLREQILGDTALLESVLGQDNIKTIVADVILTDDVLEIAVTDDTFKATLIEKIVGNEDIRDKVSATTLFKNYVLTQIKKDDTLKDEIREKLATDASLRETIITNADLLDLFLGDSTLKATIISSAVDNDLFISKIIENDGLKDLIINNMSGNQDFIDLLIHTDAFADFIVSALHSTGSPFKTHVLELLEEESVKADMHEIIKDNDDFRAELESDELKAQVMDSIDEYISHGDIDDLVAYIWYRTLGDTYTGGREADYENFITNEMIEEFKGILYEHRPDKAIGWNEFFDYLTSTPDAREDVKASADADVRAKIDTELTQYKEDVLADFIDDGVITNPDGTENLDIENEIDVAILEIIKEYIKTETTGNADADAHIEHEMVEYTKKIVMSEPDDLHQDIVGHVEDIKEDFKESIIDIDNDILIQSIIDFRDGSEDNKLILTDVIDGNFANITTYIKENVGGDSELMGTISDMIADFAYSLSNELINELIEFIGDGHTVISTIVSEYIGGLSEDELKAEIDAFVEETSDDDILGMVQELRDDPTLDLKGVIQGDEIYAKITEYLVDNIGNGTIYAKVDNVLKTQAGNIDNDTVADLILTLLNDSDNSYLVTDYLADYVTNSQNETKVRGYIADFIESDTLNETFIHENRATIESVINSVDVSGMITNDFIKTYINKLEGTEKDEFINDVYDAVLELDYFEEFIAVFDNKGESFEINKDNLAFVKAISDGINGFTYDSIIEYISFKGFDKIEELLGDRFLEPLFNRAKEEYVAGLNDAIAEVEADDTKTVNYTTSMVFKLDIINDVLVKLYDEATKKAVDALYRVEGIRYDKNDYLYSLVEYNNLIEEMFEDANRVDGDPLNETLTGWKLRTPIEYYDVALGKVILLDDAICWYGDNLTEDQIDAIFSAVINKGFAVHDKLNEIINDYDLYHSLPEKVQEVIDRVSQINSFITKYQSQIDSLVDAYLNSGLNQKFESSVITDKQTFDEVIDIIFGTEEHPIFNIDSVYLLLEKAVDSEFRAKLHQKLVNGEPRITKALERFQSTDFGKLLDGVGNATVTSMADKAQEFASSGKITSAYSRVYDVLLHITDPDIGPDAFKVTVDDPSIKAVEDAYRISIKGIEFKFMRYYK